MSISAPPVPAQLVVSVLGADWDAFWPALGRDLESLFGPADYERGPIPFTYTSYYDAELGAPIARRLLGYERTVSQDGLAAAKRATNALERKYARTDGRRTCNIDPGLLTQERLVLATGKNFTHRVYLGDGIFADLTLIFQNGDWRSLPWTFRDYASPEIQSPLHELRALHKRKLAALETQNTTR